MNLKVPGPHKIEFGTLTVKTTEAGIVINFVESWQEINADEYGQMPAGLLFTGKMAEVSCVAVMDKANWNDNYPFGLGQLSASLDDIGTCLKGSSYCKALTISNANSENWVASKALLRAPSQLPLRASKEMRVPISFVCLRDDDGDVFSTVPKYISGT